MKFTDKTSARESAVVSLGNVGCVGSVGITFQCQLQCATGYYRYLYSDTELCSHIMSDFLING